MQTKFIKIASQIFIVQTTLYVEYDLKPNSEYKIEPNKFLLLLLLITNLDVLIDKFIIKYHQMSQNT